MEQEKELKEKKLVDHKKLCVEITGAAILFGVCLFGAYKLGIDDGEHKEYQRLLTKIFDRSQAGNPICLMNYDIDKKVKFITEIVDPVTITEF